MRRAGKGAIEKKTCTDSVNGGLAPEAHVAHLPVAVHIRHLPVAHLLKLAPLHVVHIVGLNEPSAAQPHPANAFVVFGYLAPKLTLLKSG